MILVRVESADLSAESPGTGNGAQRTENWEAATETASEIGISIQQKWEQVFDKKR